jgi:hypothetical protein
MNNKRKKQRIGLLDWSRIPTVEPKMTPRLETKAEFIARENREKQARKDAPLLKLQNEHTALLRENNAHVREFFSQPIATMGECRFSSQPVDMAGTYVERVGDRDQDAERAAMYEFFDGLNAKSITISEDGAYRYAKFIVMLSIQRNIAPSQENLQQAFERLYHDLGAFAPGEVTGEVPKIVHPQPSLTYSGEAGRTRYEDERFEQLSTESREGRAACLAIVSRRYGKEVEAFYRLWADSMRDNWNVDVLVPAITKFTGEFFMRGNLNPLKHQNYDKARVALAKAGLLGPGDHQQWMLETEKVSELLEAAPDISSFEARRDIARRMRAIEDHR